MYFCHRNNGLKTFIKNISISDDDLINAYIGKNADKLKNGTFSANTFFFGSLYVLYRKMWLLGIGWLVVNLIVGAFLEPVSNVISIALSVVLGLKFKNLYLEHVIEEVNKIKIEKNGKNFIYKVKDSSNNQTTIIKQAEIKDDVKPKITLKGKQIEYLKINSTYEEQGAVAHDTCDGDITNNIKITNNVDPNKKGTYRVKYEVTDKSGNKNETIRTVKVEEQKNITKPNGKTIYLTFDDGPGKDTEKLLNILKKYNIKVTFFVTKNVNKYKEILKREYNEGHTIGLHTWSHNYSIYKDEKTYFYDLHKIENAVYEITGHKSKIIRFPGGSSNTISKSYQKGIIQNPVILVGVFLYVVDQLDHREDGAHTISHATASTGFLTNTAVLEWDLLVLFTHSITAYTHLSKYEGCASVCLFYIRGRDQTDVCFEFLMEDPVDYDRYFILAFFVDVE